MKCGVGAYTKRLAIALAEYGGMNITVLTDVRAGKPVNIDGVEVLSIVRAWKYLELFRIARSIQQLKPDIVHIQYPTQGFLEGNIAKLLPLMIRLLGKTCIQTWHEPILGLSSFYLTVGLKELISVRDNIILKSPKLTQIALKNTKLNWMPAASLLPTVMLSEDKRLEIHNIYASENKILLVFYGFVAPLKGIETLLEIVATINVRLVLVCDLQENNEYHISLLKKIKAMDISSHITITGFLEETELVSILRASDAIVLPFRDGAGSWNTSVDGAVAQGNFVLTTSNENSGYIKEKNIYFAKPGNIKEMINAIQKFAGHRVSCKSPVLEWRHIAEQHVNIYKQLRYQHD